MLNTTVDLTGKEEGPQLASTFSAYTAVQIDVGGNILFSSVGTLIFQLDLLNFHFMYFDVLKVDLVIESVELI